MSGSVHQRDEDTADSSPDHQRQRTMRDDGSAEVYEHESVFCFAARNRRGRFYIPLTTNSFGGLPVPHVLLDSGCSTLLLPFPLDRGFPQDFTTPEYYSWAVSSSQGTGAVHSPVLKIKRRMGGKFPCILAGKDQPRLEMLRFHLGSQAANRLLDPALGYRRLLDANSLTKLTDFISVLGARESRERSYALLGQSYLRQVMYCQLGDVALALSTDFDGTENIKLIIGRYELKLAPLVESFEGFHDFEDDDGDEDEEDYRLSWDVVGSEDEVDEPDDR